GCNGTRVRRSRLPHASRSRGAGSLRLLTPAMAAGGARDVVGEFVETMCGSFRLELRRGRICAEQVRELNGRKERSQVKAGIGIGAKLVKVPRRQFGGT